MYKKEPTLRPRDFNLGRWHTITKEVQHLRRALLDAPSVGMNETTLRTRDF